jgi:hypothetical protein
VALAGASGTTGTLCGFLSRSLRQGGSGDVRRPAEVGLALVDRRRRTHGRHPSLWRVPGYRSLAGGAALLFILATLAVVGWWVPFRWWRVMAIGGAILSLLLMVGFFGATKLLPMALDLMVLWEAITERTSAPATG